MQRSKWQTSLIRNWIKRASIREAFLNVIQLAVRKEIREALSQGGFSFDDRLLHTEEASKEASPDWPLPQLSQIAVHTEAGAQNATLSYRGIQTWIRRNLGV